jgi:hypothetical protein
MHRDWPGLQLIILLPLADLWWNLAHLNIGLVDFYGLSAFAQAFAVSGAWPATPYFPAGYPLLLIPFGYLGSTLIGGYILTALGMMLALYASWMLARQMGAGRLAGVAAVLLCWLAPVCRVVSGSPSVDALYTGLGLWFLASAIVAWRSSGKDNMAGQGGGPRWVLWGMLLPALLLPLLRYHAIVLLVPVLLVLMLRRRNFKTAGLSLIMAGLAVAFNYGSYYVSYHKAVPSAAAIQILTGLEIRYHLLYPDGSDYIWADYVAFCQRARQTPITSIYTSEEVANSWLENWGKFMRQPSIVVLCLLLAGAIITRKQLPRGSILGLAWVAAYTLVLAVTYYTARAALLPVLLAVTLCIAIAQNFATPSRRWLIASTAILLLAGFCCVSSFAANDYKERMLWAKNSRLLARVVDKRQGLLSDVFASDWRFLPLHHNRWTAPYVTYSNSWIDDPEIEASQRNAIHNMPYGNLSLEPPPVHYVAVYKEDSNTTITSNLVSLLNCLSQWQQITLPEATGQLAIYEYAFYSDAFSSTPPP